MASTPSGRHRPGDRTLLGLLTLLVTGPPSPAQHPLNLAVYVALTVAVAIRRKWFSVAYLMVIGAGLVNVAASDKTMVGPAHLAMPILLYTAAAIGPQWARQLGICWILAAPMLLLWSQDVYGSLRELGNHSPGLLLAFFISAYRSTVAPWTTLAPAGRWSTSRSPASWR